MTPPASAPIDIWLLVFPHFLLLDATGPVQVFSSANDEARDAGLAPPYRIRVAAAGGGAVVSSSGVSLLAEPLPRRSLAGATLIVSGGRVADLPSGCTLDGQAQLRWVARAGEAAARCCSVCTGSFVLARAGLLAGRRAVTHWADVPALRSEQPHLDVLDDALHVRDGKFYTSAGISAGMDLALSLVEEDLGREQALAVAKRMVLFLKRPGGRARTDRIAGRVDRLRNPVQIGLAVDLHLLARQVDIDLRLLVDFLHGLGHAAHAVFASHVFHGQFIHRRCSFG
jgi:transcriptional regulator GlxA family with amidase domain